tara:strand:+ start:68 stop:337 length:270 start_codon:yes stop_codon:yes gene_type:complete
MPLKLKNPFGKSKKKHKKIKSTKRLLSSDERKRVSYLQSLLREEKKAADKILGTSLKDSFEKWLRTETRKHSPRRTKKKSKTRKKKSKK